MKTLYLRIYLTVVAVLLLFALVSGWLLQRNLEQERARFEASSAERLAAWGDLLQNVLPPPAAPVAEQREAVLDWAQRLRLPLALDDASGTRLAASPSFVRWEDRLQDRPGAADRLGPQRLALSDGRVLWIVRPGALRAAARGDDERLFGMRRGPPLPLPLHGLGLVVTLGVLFAGVAIGAYPVVRRLTRRLESLQRGVEAFGAGDLHRRVEVGGRDELAAVAASFNAAAARIESLIQANRSLLANASHELRSPLARLKMALAMLEDAPDARRAGLRQEIARNIAELDTLVEEVLLASRLEAQRGKADGAGVTAAREPVDLVALSAEEAAQVDAQLELPEPGDAAAALPATVPGEERLLRRALRNLLENARRYGGAGAPELRLRRIAGQRVEVAVSDRGPGVPPAERERIFEPFYRLPGHAEQAGGVGLGLSLVRQIARHHGGEARCEAREGGGSRFVIELPAL